MAQTATCNTPPNLPINGTFATTEQFCTYYQISRTTWWRWSRTDGFPKALRFGRSVRWPADAVEAFLNQQGA
ncbi:AlpA family transcriptional regulator [Azomonas agilis]|uniref:AlpA family transcriptional regulator n=1 Tax=Azomonas agilis TaxID=116849 RepID=A0A562IZ29_9GAMM|nr:helix-turn-helix domain-containing protein [Azomonas agilis]TWH76269.1 AlpA family transcriptional regulator [Azomonas agilis]